MGKTINLLSSGAGQLSNPSALMPLANPTTGVAGKVSLAQLATIFSPSKQKYVATGSEGTSLTISALAGRTILLVVREGAPLYDTISSPDSTEYTWSGTVLGFQIALRAGERFNILYV